MMVIKLNWYSAGSNLQDLSLTHKHLEQAAAECDNAYWTKWIINMTMNYMADQLVAPLPLWLANWTLGLCLFSFVLICWLVPLLLAVKRSNADLELEKFMSHTMLSFHSICVMFVSTRCGFDPIKWTHLWFPEGQNPTQLSYLMNLYQIQRQNPHLLLKVSSVQ